MPSTPLSKTNKPLAIFDVDGTQFKSACVEKVIEEGIRQDIFQEGYFEEAMAKRRLWQADNNEGVYQSYIHNLVGGFVATMAGVEVERFEAVTHKMVAEHQVRQFKFTRNLARILKPSHTLVAISGSPTIVVKPFLEGAGFDHIIGSSFETKDGVFTGAASSVNKADELGKIASEYSTLSVGIGDTVGDIPVLSRAKCAIAFNPSQTLRNKAIAEGWYMVSETKDAVTQFLPVGSGYQPVFDSSPSIILDQAGIKL